MNGAIEDRDIGNGRSFRDYVAENSTSNVDPFTFDCSSTMGLGASSSNTLVQGSTRGVYFPFNVIPYNGVHIKPIGSNANYRLLGSGNLGPSSYTTSVGSMSFSLFDVFGNNAFSLVVVSVGGNPSFWKQNMVQGTVPSQGVTTRVFSTQVLSNPWKGSVPS
jgi:hypothetical protein